MLHGPAVGVVGGEEINCGALHRLLRVGEIVRCIQQGIVGDGALLVLKLRRCIAELLGLQRDLAGLPDLPVVVYLVIKGLEAPLIVLDGVVIGVLGRLPGVLGLAGGQAVAAAVVVLKALPLI